MATAFNGSTHQEVPGTISVPVIESMSGADVKMQDQVWDADDREEIISEIDVERSVIVDFNKRRAEIQEGCCFGLNDGCQPW